MSGEVIQFVDSISATATVRLSLTSAPWTVVNNGTSVAPPPLRRATQSLPLFDGSIIQSTAYDNRVVRLHLVLNTRNGATAATQLQLLHRELDRAFNYLRWQPDPDIPAVYFKTYRSPDYQGDYDYGTGIYDLAVEIAADPFAIGLVQTVTPVAVSNDPNAANGRFMDIAAPMGDVETPLKITIAGASVVNRQSLFAVRRRGAPSGMPFFIQAESMSQGDSTTVTAATDATGGGASPAGAASNSSACTFAVNNNMTLPRLSTSAFPAAPTVEARGQYRVFARVRPGTAGAVFTIALEHGNRLVRNSTVTTSVTTTTYTMVDLGLVQMPEGIDPITDGPGGAVLSVVGVSLRLYAQRISGSGSLIMDYLMFVPADDRLGIVTWGSITPTSFIVDGTSRSIYGIDGSGRIFDLSSIGFVGDYPTVTPGVTNRLVYLNDVQPTPGSTDPVATTVSVACSYWPRYLTVRPVSS